MGLWGLNNASCSICCEIWHFYMDLLDGDLLSNFCPFLWHMKAQSQKLRNSPTVLLQRIHKPLNMWYALWSYYICNLTLSNRLWGKEGCNLSHILNCKSIRDLKVKSPRVLHFGWETQVPRDSINGLAVVYYWWFEEAMKHVVSWSHLPFGCPLDFLSIVNAWMHLCLIMIRANWLPQCN